MLNDNVITCTRQKYEIPYVEASVWTFKSVSSRFGGGDGFGLDATTWAKPKMASFGKYDN